MVLSITPADLARQKDKDGKLPLHYFISTCIHACCNSSMSTSRVPVAKMIEIIDLFVKMYPNSINTPDPTSGLFPFMHASLQASDVMRSTASSLPQSAEENPLSIVYTLLRDDPSLTEPNPSS
jgi:hypothetical protein